MDAKVFHKSITLQQIIFFTFIKFICSKLKKYIKQKNNSEFNKQELLSLKLCWKVEPDTKSTYIWFLSR